MYVCMYAEDIAALVWLHARCSGRGHFEVFN